MNSNLKTLLGVLLLVVVIAFVYPWYSKNKTEKEKTLVQNTELELGSLIIKNHDCDAVIEQATVFLRTHSTAEAVWSVLGGCQFDRGMFSDAKISFQKVLSLDPGNIAAQNYLKKLDFKPGAVVVSATEISISQKEFETALGIVTDNTLLFVRAVRKPSNIPDYLSAEYTSRKSYADTIASVKGILTKDKIEFKLSGSDPVSVVSYGNSQETKLIIVEKGTDSTVKVHMNYQRFTN